MVQFLWLEPHFLYEQFLLLLISYKDIRFFFFRNGYLLITAAWLITIAFLFNNYWLYYSSPQGVRVSLEKNLQQRERAFNKLAGNRELVEKLLNRDYDENILHQLSGKERDFYIFTYRDNWETFWSTNNMSLEINPQFLAEGSYFRRFKSGYYEIIKKDIDGQYPGQRFIIGALPIKQEYYYSNSYLPDQFYQLPRIGRQYVINENRQGLPIHNIQGQTLFYLQFRSSEGNVQPSWISGLLRAVAIVCILIFINLFAVFLGRRLNHWWGFLFLFAILFILRLLSYAGPFPFNFRVYELFDPRIYASSTILPSLGDLLINVLLTFWLIMYFRTHLAESLHLPKWEKKWNYVAIMLLCALLYAVGDFFSHIIESLVIDSKISFDVTDVFSLTLYSILGFVILGLFTFCFFFFSQILNRLLDQLTGNNRSEKYTFLAVVALLWLLLHIRTPDLGFVVALVVWVIFYIYLLDIIYDRLSARMSTVPFVFWLLLLTITTTAVLVYYNNQRELESRQQLARKLSKQKDPTLEFNLEVINKNLQQDAYLKNYLRLKDTLHKDELTGHLEEQYFNNLTSRYDLSFYTYSDSGQILNNIDTSSLSSFNYLIGRYTEPSNSSDIFFHELSYSKYSYISRLAIYDSLDHHLDGYLYYRLRPKLFKQETLYPELLTQPNDITQNLYSEKYSYAVYDKLQLVSHRNDYPFPLQLTLKELPLSEFSYQDADGYSQLWYRPEKDKVIIIVKHSRNLIETITLFAYMFCIFLILTAIYKVIDLLIKARMRPEALRSMLNISIRSQIHSTIIFTVFFAFVILAAATISFFITRYDKEHRDTLSKDISVILADVQKRYQNSLGFTDPSNDYYSLAFQNRLRNAVQSIADIHGVDINIYDLDGNLNITTQNLIYDNGLLSRKMDPEAYYQLQYLKQVQVIEQEKVGNLSYLSSYVPIRDYKGEILAYLNRPYFASQTDLNQEISNFLVALINLNAFIFLLSGLLAVFITNSITRSFTLISEKMKKVNLGQRNEEIAWSRNDEIGMLVDEYNKMVLKLDESAVRLAKSEREGAWREMARQVAHEIKNPLTPMKLSLQYLEKAIRNNAGNVKQLTEQVSRTLIEQIEHLSQIASDFSAFANIAYAHNEKLLLNELLYSVISLYQGYPETEVLYEPPARLFYVMADKTQLNRVFTNLLQNAIQAIPEDTVGHIIVKVKSVGEKVIISISDNGTGIPEDVQSRIFTPNFTTKSSGTGLGLAMCKNIVELIRGRMWFETNPGYGSTFFVELPLLSGEASRSKISEAEKRV